MSENQENVPANHQKEDDANSISSLQAKLGNLEDNLNTLMRVGLKRDEIMHKAMSQLSRLNEAVTTLMKGKVSEEVSEEDCNFFNTLQVYVGNVGPNATEKDLEEYFKKFGKVIDVWFLKKHSNSQCALIQFSEKEMVDAALNTRIHTIYGRRIFVSKAINRFHMKALNLTRGVKGFSSSTLSLKSKSPSKGTTRNNRYDPY